MYGKNNIKKQNNYKYKEGRLNQIVCSTSIIMLFEFF